MSQAMSRSVLVVDDEPGLAFTLQRVLGFSGFEAVCVESGARALQAIESQLFDVVVTDIFLPDIDGPQIIAASRRRNRGTLIVAISGGGAYMTSRDALNVAVKLGADGVLMKPFTPSELIELIHGLLGGGDPAA
jgi:CheY-like chemotaxis protein